MRRTPFFRHLLLECLLENAPLLAASILMTLLGFRFGKTCTYIGISLVLAFFLGCAFQLILKKVFSSRFSDVNEEHQTQETKSQTPKEHENQRIKESGNDGETEEKNENKHDRPNCQDSADSQDGINS